MSKSLPKIEWVNPLKIRVGVIELWKHIDSDYLDRIIEMIKEDGITTPLILTPDMQLIDGHYRRKAAIQLRIKLVPVIHVPFVVEPEEKNA